MWLKLNTTHPIHNMSIQKDFVLAWRLNYSDEVGGGRTEQRLPVWGSNFNVYTKALAFRLWPIKYKIWYDHTLKIKLYIQYNKACTTTSSLNRTLSWPADALVLHRNMQNQHSITWTTESKLICSCLYDQCLGPIIPFRWIDIQPVR